MDDDEDEREFSKSIVYGFFEQAETTFTKMDASLYVEDGSISLAYFYSLALPSIFDQSEHIPDMALGRPQKAKTISTYEPSLRLLQPYILHYLTHRPPSEYDHGR